MRSVAPRHQTLPRGPRSDGQGRAEAQPGIHLEALDYAREDWRKKPQALPWRDAQLAGQARQDTRCLLSWLAHMVLIAGLKSAIRYPRLREMSVNAFSFKALYHSRNNSSLRFLGWCTFDRSHSSNVESYT